MSTADGKKALRDITFSGKREDYMMWAAKLLSYAQVKGFKKVLLGQETPVADISKLEKAELEAVIRINKANDLAYSMLHIAVKGDVSFNAIYSATTDTLPDGDAKLAWDQLEKIFKP